MQIKEYRTFKTAAKTARENNLILADKIFNNTKRLFDFSLLDGIIIPNIEKEVIKADALKNVTACNRASFYWKEFDNFSACEGIADYYVQRVFSASGKHLYNIFTLAKVQHYSKDRKSVYENYNITACEVSSKYTEPINDIEIA